MSEMKFDVIVGNPPYQVGTEGHGATASTIYNHFVTRAIELNPRYVLMITPSRWFSGGKGLDEYRERMIEDRRIRVLVDNPKSFDCFPGVKRSEEHTSELQSLMRISYAVFCLKKKTNKQYIHR